MKILELLKKKWKRPWGYYKVLHKGYNTEKEWKVKFLEVDPYKYLSYQNHGLREEFWVCVQGHGKVKLENRLIDITQGSMIHIPLRAKHQLINTSDTALIIVETQYGDMCDESDITRYSD